MKIGFAFLAIAACGTLTIRCKPVTKENIAFEKKVIQPPNPDQIPHDITANGNTRVDNYYWMKLTEEQRDAEVKTDKTKKEIKN
jgi:oligopeptidase B